MRRLGAICTPEDAGISHSIATYIYQVRLAPPIVSVVVPLSAPPSRTTDTTRSAERDVVAQLRRIGGRLFQTQYSWEYHEPGNHVARIGLTAAIIGVMALKEIA